jgi:hypothetical protein
MEVSKLYKVKTSAAGELDVYGSPVDVSEDSISLAIDATSGYGWNWIGFPISSTLPLNDALVNAEPIQDEVIKGQSGFAMYYPGIGWVGTLNKLEAGKGYLYMAKKDRKFVYPSSSLRSAVVSAEETTNHWVVNSHKYPSTMSIVAVVSGLDIAKEDELAAFYADEVCGVVTPQYVEGKGWLFPLYIYGETSGKNLTFKYFDASAQKEYTISEEVDFTADMLLGTPDSPYILNISFADSEEVVISAYPKPVVDVLNISHVVSGIYVYDVAGSLVHKEESFEGKVMDLSNVNVGYYLLKTYYQGKEVIIPFIKK